MLPDFHGVAHDPRTLPTQPNVFFDSLVMGRGFGFSPICLNSDGHSFSHDSPTLNAHLL